MIKGGYVHYWMNLGSCEDKEWMTVTSMHECIKLITLVASSNFLLVHFGISQFRASVFFSRKEEGRGICVRGHTDTFFVTERQ